MGVRTAALVAPPSTAGQGAQGYGVGLAEEPGDEVLQRVCQRIVAVLHEARKDAWQQVAGHADHPLRVVQVPPRVRLVVVPAPAQHAVLIVALDATVAGALLDAQKVKVLRQREHDVGGDVLACAPRHVVHNRRALVQHRLQVAQEPCCRGLAIVWVDLQRRVHADRKALRARRRQARVTGGLLHVRPPRPAAPVDG